MHPTTKTGNLPSVDAHCRLKQHEQLTYSPDTVHQDYLMFDTRQHSISDGDDGDSDLEKSPRNLNNILAMKSQVWHYTAYLYLFWKRFYRGIHHSIYFAQADSGFRQMTTTTVVMVLAMPPMLMMMIMMIMMIMMWSADTNITLYKLVMTWQYTATKDDAWLELKPTQTVQLGLSPRTREWWSLGMLQPGGCRFDPSVHVRINQYWQE